MPLLLDCPRCTRKLRVPDDLLGTQVQCPSCGMVFVGNGAPTSPPPLPSELPPLPSTEPGAPPTGEAAVKLSPGEGAGAAPSRGEAPKQHGDNDDAARTPRRRRFTREDEDDDDDDRPWDRRGYHVRRDCEPHRGGTVLALGIISIVMMGPIGLALGIPAWIMGGRDLRKIRQRIMDPEGQGTTQAGWICGIIGTILSSLMTLGCIAYLAFIVFFMNMVVQSVTVKQTMPPTQQPVPIQKKMQKMEIVPKQAP